MQQEKCSEKQNYECVYYICLLPHSGFVRARGGADIRDVNTNSENWAVVKAALVAGMYPNLVHVDRGNLVLTGPKEKKVRFHPTSVLNQTQYKKVKSLTVFCQVQIQRYYIKFMKVLEMSFHSCTFKSSVCGSY